MCRLRQSGVSTEATSYVDKIIDVDAKLFKERNLFARLKFYLTELNSQLQKQ